jgi:hypothetical protein
MRDQGIAERKCMAAFWKRGPIKDEICMRLCAY